MKPGRDPKYLEWIRQQACMICKTHPVECAHVGDRGLGQRCPDRQSVPLCVEHHREGPESHHVLGKKFWAYHHLSRDTVLRVYAQSFSDEMEFC
jgi:hypothetical protein